jgi:hypothetical protein
MSDASDRPVIFISYAQPDEPEKPTEGEVQWLSFVRRYLQPAVKDRIFDLWVDRHMPPRWKYFWNSSRKLCSPLLR